MAEQGAFFSSDPVDVSFYQTSRLTEPTLPFNGSSEADAWYGSLALPEPFKFPDFSVPPAMTYAAHNEGGGSVDVQDFRAIGFDNLPNTISAADDVGSGPEPGRLGPAAPLPTAGVRRGHTRRQAKRKRVETPEEQADGQVSDETSHVSDATQIDTATGATDNAAQDADAILQPHASPQATATEAYLALTLPSPAWLPGPWTVSLPAGSHVRYTRLSNTAYDVSITIEQQQPPITITFIDESLQRVESEGSEGLESGMAGSRGSSEDAEGEEED